MDFRRGRAREELEINLIPLIDVLLVVIIFLMLTTTYSKNSGLEINLPTSEATPLEAPSTEINVAVTATGEVTVNRVAVAGREINAIADAMRRVVPEGAQQAPVVIINADARASHQSVINVMQAAQRAGLSAVTFATQPGK